MAGRMTVKAGAKTAATKSAAARGGSASRRLRRAERKIRLVRHISELPPPPPELVELRKKQRKEQEKNNPVFAAMLPRLLKTRRGQWAVMKKGALAGFYPTLGDAGKAGDRRYRSGVYSLHEIDDREIDLGMFPL